MFRIDLPEVDRADALLGEAYELDAKPVYLAWRAYSRIFYVAEHIHADRGARSKRRKSTSGAPSKPIRTMPPCLRWPRTSTASFSVNIALGHELAELSVKCNPAYPLGHAFLGRAKSYLGEHEAGYAATRRGLDLSGQGPYRYMLHFFTA